MKTHRALFFVPLLLCLLSSGPLSSEPAICWLAHWHLSAKLYGDDGRDTLTGIQAIARSVKAKFVVVTPHDRNMAIQQAKNPNFTRQLLDRIRQQNALPGQPKLILSSEFTTHAPFPSSQEVARETHLYFAFLNFERQEARISDLIDTLVPANQTKEQAWGKGRRQESTPAQEVLLGHLTDLAQGLPDPPVPQIDGLFTERLDPPHLLVIAHPNLHAFNLPHPVTGYGPPPLQDLISSFGSRETSWLSGIRQPRLQSFFEWWPFIGIEVFNQSPGSSPIPILTLAQNIHDLGFNVVFVAGADRHDPLGLPPYPIPELRRNFMTGDRDFEWDIIQNVATYGKFDVVSLDPPPHAVVSHFQLKLQLAFWQKPPKDWTWYLSSDFLLHHVIASGRVPQNGLIRWSPTTSLQPGTWFLSVWDSNKIVLYTTVDYDG